MSKRPRRDHAGHEGEDGGLLWTAKLVDGAAELFASEPKGGRRRPGGSDRAALVPVDGLPGAIDDLIAVGAGRG